MMFKMKLKVASIFIIGLFAFSGGSQGNISQNNFVTLKNILLTQSVSNNIILAQKKDYRGRGSYKGKSYRGQRGYRGQKGYRGSRYKGYKRYRGYTPRYYRYQRQYPYYYRYNRSRYYYPYRGYYPYYNYPRYYPYRYYGYPYSKRCVRNCYWNYTYQQYICSYSCY